MINYKNSSFTLAGTASLVYILNILFWRLGVDEQSLVPGFSFMTGLVAPILSAWLGTMVRHFAGEPKRWLSILLGLFALVLFFKYITYPDIFTLTNQSCLDASLMIMAYLIPVKQLETFASQDRFVPSVMVFLAAVLCYTCIEVTDGRLYNFPFPAENEDMHELIRLLLQIAEGTTTAIAVYFAVILSYSSVGQTISSHLWVRIVFGVLCVLASARMLEMAFMLGFPSVFSFISIASCPLCVYLVVLVFRGYKKHHGENLD